MSRKSSRRVYAQLDALYARLPSIQCRGLCAMACGPIPLTDLEARRLQQTTHQPPRTVHDTRCVYLQNNRCSAYAVRPLICRAYGLLEALSCPHGCVPDRWLTEREFLQLAVAIEQLGGGRVVRTDPEGLVTLGESFRALAARIRLSGQRPDDAIAADAARTRGLRALHGGRVIYARRE